MPALAVPRVLLFAAHPDDETIGAGSFLSRQPTAEVIHVTDGAPRNMRDATAAGFPTQAAYAAARITEVKNALQLAGIQSAAIKNMHYTDQQVSHQLKDLTIDILGIFREHTPELVLTHAYEGGHPDHDAVAFACHLALKILRRQATHTAPRLMEFAAYHGNNGSIKTYDFIPQHGVPERAPEIRRELTPDEQVLKTKMLGAFLTQTKTLQAFLPPKVEAYREAPEYDFTRPPHEGKLYYEHFDWGMDGARWRKLAREAVRDLGFPAKS